MAEFEPKQFGRYYLLEKLAVGGMAEIYKAKTFGVDGFEKLLVMKRILPHCAADKDFITMLVDEAKLSVTLSHANIVQVYDLGKVGDDYFISMEYINGVNLRDIIYRCKERGVTIPDELATYIVSEICKGLDYAHRKTDPSGHPLNIVHRDVSPQNILLSYEGEVKIVDFGIAKAAMNISHTMAGILKGKIAYMSPEQSLGKVTDYRADIFSTGLVLYESLTLEKLFTGESQFEVLKKIRTTRLDSTKFAESIPEGLKQILAKALIYSPKDRYQTAGDMQIDLTKFLYTAHVDFTPQKLASFIKDLFADEIAKQHERGALEKIVEAQTSSINIAEEAMQENLVHREETSPTVHTDEGVKARVMETRELTDRTVIKKGLGKRLAAVASVMILLVGIGIAYVKFLHPVVTGKSKQATIGKTGTLNVVSTPPGAEIFLDGEDTDLMTPAILENLTIGKAYKVKLSKDQFADAEQKVEITSIEPISVELALEAAAGTLDISSEPAGAAVIVNGVPTGDITPRKLTSLPLNSDLKITLTKQDYKDFEQTVKLTSYKPQTLFAKLALSTKIGSIVVESTPPGAQIFLNGRDTGLSTPATLPNIKIGDRQNIRLTKSEFNDATKSVTLKDPSPLTVGMEMVPLKAREEEKTAVTPPKPKPEAKQPKKPPVVAPTPATPPPAAAAPVETKPAPAPTQPPAQPAAQPAEKSAPEQVTFPAGSGPGTIKISSDPSGAEVFINAEYQGTTPVTISNVKPGTVSLLVNKEGRARFSQKFTLQPGEKKDFGTVKLGNLYGSISITSSPSRAAVIIDGEDVGAKTPVTIKKVRRDKQHTIKLVLEGYWPWERTFDMEGANEKKFNVILDKE